jgi:transposase
MEYVPEMTYAERRARRKAMAKCVKEGLSAREVAKRFGVTEDTVYTACEEWEVLGHRQTDIASRCYELRKAMAKRVKEGLSVREVAKSFEVTRMTVYTACREWKVTLPGRKAVIKDAQERRRLIAAYVESGHTIGEAMEELKVSVMTVYKACREWKVELLEGKNIIAEAQRRRKAMAKCVGEGYSVVQVSKRYGVSRVTVYKACREYEVELPRLRRSLDKLRSEGRNGSPTEE